MLYYLAGILRLNIYSIYFTKFFSLETKCLLAIERLRQRFLGALFILLPSV